MAILSPLITEKTVVFFMKLHTYEKYRSNFGEVDVAPAKNNKVEK